jgi:hypothetical protein
MLNLDNILETINEMNINDAIYFYASLLEKLVEMKKEHQNDESDDDSDIDLNDDIFIDSDDDIDLITCAPSA